MHPQPGGQKNSRTSSSHHEYTGNTQHSRTQWFTAYFVLSPVIGPVIGLC
jgi:hypothetical protein